MNGAIEPNGFSAVATAIAYVLAAIFGAISAYLTYCWQKNRADKENASRESAQRASATTEVYAQLQSIIVIMKEDRAAWEAKYMEKCIEASAATARANTLEQRLLDMERKLHLGDQL